MKEVFWKQGDHFYQRVGGTFVHLGVFPTQAGRPPRFRKEKAFPLSRTYPYFLSIAKQMSAMGKPTRVIFQTKGKSPGICFLGAHRAPHGALAPFTQDEVKQILQIGSVAGFIAELWLTKLFPKLRRDPDQKTPDLFCDDNWFEVRTLTKTGCPLIPSGQIGKGRVYNKGEYCENLRNIVGTLLVDTRLFDTTGMWKVYWISAKIQFRVFGKEINSKRSRSLLENEGDLERSAVGPVEKRAFGQVLYQDGLEPPPGVFSRRK